MDRDSGRHRGLVDFVIHIAHFRDPDFLTLVDRGGIGQHVARVVPVEVGGPDPHVFRCVRVVQGGVTQDGEVAPSGALGHDDAHGHRGEKVAAGEGRAHRRDQVMDLIRVHGGAFIRHGIVRLVQRRQADQGDPV